MRPLWTILIVIAGGAAACALDMPAFHFVDNHIEAHIKEKIPSQVIWGFQDFAQTIPPLAIIWAVWRLDRRRGRAIVLRMFLAFVAAGAVSGMAKLLVGRHRPEYFRGETWAQTWIDAGWADRNSKQESFFSGHSAAAFTMATILSAYYAPLRPVVYALAAGCAASRIVTEQHWTSDVYIGSVTGLALGWLFLPVPLRRARRDRISASGEARLARASSG
jgi:membrane-associated phospholipid phosphatase